MICPLLLIGDRRELVECLQEKCAWWIKRHEWKDNYPCQAHCGILDDMFGFSAPDKEAK
jgi:hypothetical protein